MRKPQLLRNNDNLASSVSNGLLSASPITTTTPATSSSLPFSASPAARFGIELDEDINHCRTAVVAIKASYQGTMTAQQLLDNPQALQRFMQEEFQPLLSCLMDLARNLYYRGSYFQSLREMLSELKTLLDGVQDNALAALKVHHASLTSSSKKIDKKHLRSEAELASGMEYVIVQQCALFAGFAELYSVQAHWELANVPVATTKIAALLTLLPPACDCLHSAVESLRQQILWINKYKLTKMNTSGLAALTQLFTNAYNALILILEDDDSLLASHKNAWRVPMAALMQKMQALPLLENHCGDHQTHQACCRSLQTNLERLNPEGANYYGVIRLEYITNVLELDKSSVIAHRQDSRYRAFLEQYDLMLANVELSNQCVQLAGAEQISKTDAVTLSRQLESIKKYVAKLKAARNQAQTASTYPPALLVYYKKTNRHFGIMQYLEYLEDYINTNVSLVGGLLQLAENDTQSAQKQFIETEGHLFKNTVELHAVNLVILKMAGALLQHNDNKECFNMAMDYITLIVTQTDCHETRNRHYLTDSVLEQINSAIYRCIAELQRRVLEEINTHEQEQAILKKIDSLLLLVHTKAIYAYPHHEINFTELRLRSLLLSASSVAQDETDQQPIRFGDFVNEENKLKTFSEKLIAMLQPHLSEKTFCTEACLQAGSQYIEQLESLNYRLFVYLCAHKSVLPAIEQYTEKLIDTHLLSCSRLQDSLLSVLVNENTEPLREKLIQDMALVTAKMTVTQIFLMTRKLSFIDWNSLEPQLSQQMERIYAGLLQSIVELAKYALTKKIPIKIENLLLFQHVFIEGYFKPLQRVQYHQHFTEPLRVACEQNLIILQKSMVALKQLQHSFSDATLAVQICDTLLHYVGNARIASYNKLTFANIKSIKDSILSLKDKVNRLRAEINAFDQARQNESFAQPMTTLQEIIYWLQTAADAGTSFINVGVYSVHDLQKVINNFKSIIVIAKLAFMLADKSFTRDALADGQLQAYETFKIASLFMLIETCTVKIRLLHQSACEDALLDHPGVLLLPTLNQQNVKEIVMIFAETLSKLLSLTILYQQPALPTVSTASDDNLVQSIPKIVTLYTLVEEHLQQVLSSIGGSTESPGEIANALGLKPSLVEAKIKLIRLLSITAQQSDLFQFYEKMQLRIDSLLAFLPEPTTVAVLSATADLSADPTPAAAIMLPPLPAPAASVTTAAASATASVRLLAADGKPAQNQSQQEKVNDGIFQLDNDTLLADVEVSMAKTESVKTYFKNRLRIVDSLKGSKNLKTFIYEHFYPLLPLHNTLLRESRYHPGLFDTLCKIFADMDEMLLALKEKFMPVIEKTTALNGGTKPGKATNSTKKYAGHGPSPISNYQDTLSNQAALYCSFANLYFAQALWSYRNDIATDTTDCPMLNNLLLANGYLQRAVLHLAEQIEWNTEHRLTFFSDAPIVCLEHTLDNHLKTLILIAENSIRFKAVDKQQWRLSVAELATRIQALPHLQAHLPGHAGYRSNSQRLATLFRRLCIDQPDYYGVIDLQYRDSFFEIDTAELTRVTKDRYPILCHYVRRIVNLLRSSENAVQMSLDLLLLKKSHVKLDGLMQEVRNKVGQLTGKESFQRALLAADSEQPLIYHGASHRYFDSVGYCCYLMDYVQINLMLARGIQDFVHADFKAGLAVFESADTLLCKNAIDFHYMTWLRLKMALVLLQFDTNAQCLSSALSTLSLVMIQSDRRNLNKYNRATKNMKHLINQWIYECVLALRRCALVPEVANPYEHIIQNTLDELLKLVSYNSLYYVAAQEIDSSAVAAPHLVTSLPEYQAAGGLPSTTEGFDGAVFLQDQENITMSYDNLCLCLDEMTAQGKFSLTPFLDLAGDFVTRLNNINCRLFTTLRSHSEHLQRQRLSVENFLMLNNQRCLQLLQRISSFEISEVEEKARDHVVNVLSLLVIDCWFSQVAFINKEFFAEESNLLELNRLHLLQHTLAGCLEAIVLHCKFAEQTGGILVKVAVLDKLHQLFRHGYYFLILRLVKHPQFDALVRAVCIENLLIMRTSLQLVKQMVGIFSDTINADHLCELLLENVDALASFCYPVTTHSVIKMIAAEVHNLKVDSDKCLGGMKKNAGKQSTVVVATLLQTLTRINQRLFVIAEAGAMVIKEEPQLLPELQHIYCSLRELAGLDVRVLAQAEKSIMSHQCVTPSQQQEYRKIKTALLFRLKDLSYQTVLLAPHILVDVAALPAADMFFEQQQHSCLQRIVTTYGVYLSLVLKLIACNGSVVATVDAASNAGAGIVNVEEMAEHAQLLLDDLIANYVLGNVWQLLGPQRERILTALENINQQHQALANATRMQPRQHAHYTQMSQRFAAHFLTPLHQEPAVTLKIRFVRCSAGFTLEETCLDTAAALSQDERYLSTGAIIDRLNTSRQQFLNLMSHIHALDYSMESEARRSAVENLQDIYRQLVAQKDLLDSEETPDLSFAMRINGAAVMYDARRYVAQQVNFVTHLANYCSALLDAVAIEEQSPLPVLLQPSYQRSLQTLLQYLFDEPLKVRVIDALLAYVTPFFNQQTLPLCSLLLAELESLMVRLSKQNHRLCRELYTEVVQEIVLRLNALLTADKHWVALQESVPIALSLFKGRLLALQQIFSVTLPATLEYGYIKVLAAATGVQLLANVAQEAVPVVKPAAPLLPTPAFTEEVAHPPKDASAPTEVAPEAAAPGARFAFARPAPAPAPAPASAPASVAVVESSLHTTHLPAAAPAITSVQSAATDKPKKKRNRRRNKKEANPTQTQATSTSPSATSSTATASTQATSTSTPPALPSTRPRAFSAPPIADKDFYWSGERNGFVNMWSATHQAPHYRQSSCSSALLFATQAQRVIAGGEVWLRFGGSVVDKKVDLQQEVGQRQAQSCQARMK